MSVIRQFQNQKSNKIIRNSKNNYVLSINVCDLLKDKKLYYSLHRSLYAYIFDNPKRLSNKVIVFYTDTNAIEMKISQLVYHILFWRANVEFNIPITREFFWDITKPNKIMFENTFEFVSKILVENNNGIASKEIGECISQIKSDFSDYARSFSSVKCNTISLFSIIEFSKRNEDFRNLLNTSLDKSKPIKELEEEMVEVTRKLGKTILEDGKNCFADYYKADRLNRAQLSSVLCTVGTRADVDKTVFPWPITKGYIHGIQNAAEFVMEMATSFGVMIAKNNNLPLSGFLSREGTHIAGGISIDYDVEDCHTENFLNFYVENEDYFKMIQNKYMVLEDGSVKEITPNDSYIIGTTVRLRTVIGCALKGDKHVCKTCVGSNANRMKGTKVGMLSSIKNVNPISQKSLSGKHHTKTKSIEITNSAILKYFHNDSTTLYINPEYANDKDMYLVISQEDVEEIMYSNSLDIDDGTVDAIIDLGYLAVRDHGVDYPIENEGCRFVLSEETIQKKSIFKEDPENDDYILIPINKLGSENPVVSIIIDNEEISKYLNAFINMIDRKYNEHFKTYDELVKELVDVVYASGFVNRLIYFELTLYNMVRDLNDVTKRPDFSIKGAPYRILKISTSIENMDMFTAFSFQQFKRLLSSPSIRERYGTSQYDRFFKISDKE